MRPEERARAGKPVAMLGPIAPSSRMREPGLLEGRVRISKNFDAPLPKDVLENFYEGALQPD
ncbi:MAG: type II toxin-antitoxin system Phd/YefM family antitoxin [Myxococcota bacterium]